MVDRQNLEKIRTEMNYQMSGEVSDESARSIGRQFGVQYIVYGRVRRIGGDYRVSASDNTVLGSSRFVIPAGELDRRGLSLYPQKDGAVITRAIQPAVKGFPPPRCSQKKCPADSTSGRCTGSLFLDKLLFRS
jgi:TolB-like protein